MEDVLLLTAGMLAEDERVAAQVRRQYKWFVVDEFQDVSPLQSALLDLWLGGRDELCVVGDPAQTIYSFAGANADFLRDFPAKFPGTTSIELVRNYRSTPQVVEAANTPARRHRQPRRRPALPAGRRPRGRRYDARIPTRSPRPRRSPPGSLALRADGPRRSARWPSCSASTPSPSRSRRRWRPAASPTSSAARPGSSTAPRSARRSPGSAARPARARATGGVLETVRAHPRRHGLDARGAVRARPDPRPLGVLAGADGPGRWSSPPAAAPSTTSSTTSTAGPPSSTPPSPTASPSRRSTPPRGWSGTRSSSAASRTAPSRSPTPRRRPRSRRSGGSSTSA